ncbi:uncharacterized protein LOC125776351 [Bactrocera dorsalis]|uniref:Uncharacterized protein LOC125776351 n=1 Tax=Bactrocera dorsalis TaxID=27457 RepID=A0ABM3J4B2_BACDO|nr:uncharacterized protein LOC125776351 [Bactrocera dorsalis]
MATTKLCTCKMDSCVVLCTCRPLFCVHAGNCFVIFEVNRSTCDINMDDEILIEEVRNCPLIYDISNADYKNIRKKEMAWKEISKKTRLSEFECKNRWKSLRDCYKRCKRMEQIASGSGQQTPRRKWRYLEAMAFMETIPNSRHTISSISEEVGRIIEPSLEASTSSSTMETAQPTSSNKRGQKKKNGEALAKFLQTAGESISTMIDESRSRKTDTTAQHFASLAAKISEAGLPQEMVLHIEAKVSALVFKEISDFYSGYLG